MLYLIAYGLKKEPESYGDFYAALNALGQCMDVCEGATLCSTIVSAQVISADLKRYIDAQDKLIIVQMYRGHCAGKLNEAHKSLIRTAISQDPLEAYQWLKKRPSY